MTVLMSDFFNKFLFSRIHGVPLDPTSKHLAYIHSLRSLERFLSVNDLKRAADVSEHVGMCIEFFKAIRKVCHAQGIAIKHHYSQDLDSRMYLHEVSQGGWCLGIAAYWLKKKSSGQDLFPSEIYQDKELREAYGTPIRLMKNQMQMIKHRGQVNAGGTDIRVKNVLDYLVDGLSGNPRANLVFGGDQLKSEPDFLHRSLYSQLTPRSAPRAERRKDLFYVNIDFVGKGHVLALDFESNELFDPTYGIFFPRNGSRELLVKFFFHHFFANCYAHDVDKIQFYRVPVK
ncbi:MAG: hypothetical protein MI742_14705 [Desulfobacterales bacterium]|nr:hypothetical protein [Desulfobacterales bacterium]